MCCALIDSQKLSVAVRRLQGFGSAAQVPASYFERRKRVRVRVSKVVATPTNGDGQSVRSDHAANHGYRVEKGVVEAAAAAAAASPHAGYPAAASVEGNAGDAGDGKDRTAISRSDGGLVMYCNRCLSIFLSTLKFPKSHHGAGGGMGMM